MNTNYLIDVFTLKSEDDNSKIIAVMDSVKAAGTHVSYKDYMTKERNELMQSQMNMNQGRHFTYLKRKKHDSQIQTINKRYFGDIYAKSFPFVSKNQGLVCMPRFCRYRATNTCIQQEELLDIYDCSESSFWESSDIVEPKDKQHYKCTLKIELNDSQTFQTVKFSRTNKYAVVICTEKTLFYDLSSAENNGIQTEDDSTIVLEHIQKYEVKESTYDRVLNVYLQDDDIEESWVALQSSQYGQIHVIRLRDVIASEEKQKEKIKTLGGHFIEASDHILFKVTGGDMPKFWEQVTAKFTIDGLKCTIQTADETYMLILDSESDMYLKFAKIPYLKGKIVQQFYRGDNAILFSENDTETQVIQFSAMELEKTKNFSNTKLTCNGRLDVKEVTEFKRDGQDVFRITGIRDNEELMQWEVLDNSQGEQFFRCTNSSKVGSFRWPFYAYADSQLSLMISPIENSEFVLHHTIDVGEEIKNARIVNVDFSYGGNLFILVAAKKDYIYYRMKVKSDCHKRHKIIKLESQIGEVKNLIENTDDMIVCEELYRVERTGRSVYYFSPFEQKLGLSELITIIEQKGNELFLLTIYGNGDEDGNPPVATKYGNLVKSIHQINKNNFIIHEYNTNNIRLLTLDYQGTSFFQEKLVFRETSYDINKILAHNNRLYILSQNGNDYIFRCFRFNGCDLVPQGSIDNIRETNPTFIEEFQRSNIVNENILISNDQKIVKIYDSSCSQDTKENPTLQNYFNFLPNPKSDETDRVMPIRNLRNCPKHSRFLMQFNYPRSCKPKEILVTPFIGQNTIELNTLNWEENLAWMVNKKLDKCHEVQGMNILNTSMIAGSSCDQVQSITRIFSYCPSKWLLSEFDLVGLLQKSSNYANEFKDKQIIASGMTKLRYLLTPETKEFLEKIELIEILENHSCIVLRSFDTKNIEINVLGVKVSLFDLMYDMKNMLDCSFEFKFNLKKMEIVMAVVLPKGFIISAFVIRENEDNTPVANMIFSSPQHAETSMALFIMSKGLNAKSPDKLLIRDNSSLILSNSKKIKPDSKLYLKGLVECFKRAKSFTISDSKVIFWSKQNILHGNLDDVRDAVDNDIHLQLKESDFEIKTTITAKDKKDNRAIRRRANNQGMDELDDVLKSSQDFIENIECRHKSKKYGESSDDQQLDDLVIKLRQRENKLFFLQYDLEQDQEITSLACSQDSQLFFDSQNNFMVADPLVGIINLESKQILLEYHLDRNLPDGFSKINMSWGSKMIQTKEANYFTLPNNILMPYSMLSVIQQFQAEAYDNVMDHFFTEDYYKLSGMSQLHKFMYNPILLEKLLDDYWQQNKLFLSSVLVKQEIAQKQEQKQTMVGQVVGMGIASFFQGHKRTGSTAREKRRISKILAKSVGGSEKVNFSQIEYIDVLDAQIDMNCDKLLNKILYYLSRLPIQYSFQMMQPKLRQVVDLERFYDYLNSWLVQTSQMEQIRVLYTDLAVGQHRIQEKCSYLKKTFFDAHPTERPETDDIQKREALQKQDSEFFQDDDFFKDATEEAKNSSNRQEQQTRADDEGDDDETKILQQVDIQMLQIDWLTSTKDGMKFLKRLCLNIECLTLFQTKTLQVQIDYLWSISRKFFVQQVFVPFLLLGILPLSTMAFMIAEVDKYSYEDKNIINFVLFYLSLLAFSINTVAMAVIEAREIKAKKMKKYFTFQNFIQLFTIAINLTLVIQVLTCTGTFITVAIDHDFDSQLDNLRINMVICIVLNVIELFQRVSIFDFFALFVRQLQEISLESLPLGCMLGIIVIAQTLVFWLIDQNGAEPHYEGIAGFGNCFVDSYRLSLGDFEITGNAMDAKHSVFSIIVFWLAFFLSTLIALLIILNMVIAVMGSAFERVEAEMSSHIYRSKLILIIDNYHRFSPQIVEELQSSKYLLSVEVDPDVDPIDKDTLETRMNDKFKKVGSNLTIIQTQLNRVALNLDTMYDRLCSDAKASKVFVKTSDEQSDNEDNDDSDE